MPNLAELPRPHREIPFHVAEVLTSSNCRVIRELCGAVLSPATIQTRTGRHINEGIRRAWMAYPDEIEDSKVQLILGHLRKSISDLTRLPISHQERFQFCRYQEGDFFKWHEDGRGRVWSIVAYLSSDYDGGETEFENGQKFRGREGVSLAWQNDGKATRHRAAPVTSGVKDVLLTWVHADPV